MIRSPGRRPARLPDISSTTANTIAWSVRARKILESRSTSSPVRKAIPRTGDRIGHRWAAPIRTRPLTRARRVARSTRRSTAARFRRSTWGPVANHSSSPASTDPDPRKMARNATDSTRDDRRASDTPVMLLRGNRVRRSDAAQRLPRCSHASLEPWSASQRTRLTRDGLPALLALETGALALRLNEAPGRTITPAADKPRRTIEPGLGSGSAAAVKEKRGSSVPAH